MEMQVLPKSEGTTSCYREVRAGVQPVCQDRIALPGHKWVDNPFRGWSVEFPAE